MALKYGPFTVYVICREEEGSGNEEELARPKARYRKYFPSLSAIPGTLASFSSWAPLLKDVGEVANEMYLVERLGSYLRRQWFSNVSFFNQFLTGYCPVTHNAQVGLSFKNKKHHTDLGLQARQRSGGMNIEEYVKRAAQACRQTAVFTGTNLRYHQRNQKLAMKTEPRTKMKPSLKYLATYFNTAEKDQALNKRVFVRKGTEEASVEKVEAPQTTLDAAAATQLSQLSQKSVAELSQDVVTRSLRFGRRVKPKTKNS